MKSTTRTNNYKNFGNEFEIIDIIEGLKNTTIELHKKEFFTVKGHITKLGNKLIIEIIDNSLDSIDEDLETLEANIGNLSLLIDNFSIDNVETKINDEGISRNIFCSLNVIQNSEFNLKGSSNYRCFIPTDINRLYDFYSQFETISYQDGKTDYFYDCIRIDIDGLTFDITRLKKNDKGYFIIESTQEITFSDFSDISFSIKQALGFITSYMPGGEEYFFDKDNCFYYCNHHRSKIDSMFKPLHRNPFHLLINKREIAEKYVNKLNVLSTQVFSNLVSKIGKSKELSSAIILLLEASSIRSLLLIPSVFSVIVESLSKTISEKEVGKEFPVEDTVLFKEIQDKLNSVLTSYNDKISESGLLKLQRRVNELNKPVVKEHLTNNEKLTLPFEQLGIKLTMSDINAIEHRNDVLHGNILLSDENRSSEEEINNYMGYISAKLYTLISALILKHVGYSGYIINHSKFYEDLCKMESDEEYYKLI